MSYLQSGRDPGDSPASARRSARSALPLEGLEEKAMKTLRWSRTTACVISAALTAFAGAAAPAHSAPAHIPPRHDSRALSLDGGKDLFGPFKLCDPKGVCYKGPAETAQESESVTWRVSVVKQESRYATVKLTHYSPPSRFLRINDYSVDESQEGTELLLENTGSIWTETNHKDPLGRFLIGRNGRLAVERGKGREEVRLYNGSTEINSKNISSYSQPTNPKVPAVVFVHGMNDSAGAFNSMKQKFLNAGWKEGDLDAWEYDWRDELTGTASDLHKEVRGRFGDRRVVLVGHSLGSIPTRLMARGVNLQSWISLGGPNNFGGSKGLVQALLSMGKVANVITLGQSQQYCLAGTFAATGKAWASVCALLNSDFVNEVDHARFPRAHSICSPADTLMGCGTPYLNWGANYEIQGVTHPDLPRDAKVIDKVLEIVGKSMNCQKNISTDASEIKNGTCHV
ncbi:hypothetical protein [Streptomyces sp. NPDC003077]|uniref:esterase/lipase family protein n=1 Tax=Streptomyces sp. NPDC003077 TaxID=3154443 RepID=UPI0033B9718A